MHSKTLLSVVGPTGIGKTKLAIEIARYYATEIISCDARQFFKEIPIGTAMPDAQELAQVKHHFIASRSITQDYSIGMYEKDTMQKLQELWQKHDVVILVGGSGMYEKAVLEGLDELPVANKENIEKLTEILKQQGIEVLQNLLKELDFAYYQKADIENPRRLFRAIDICWQTKQPYSDFLNKTKPKRDFNIVRIGIEAPRELLYQRINRRVDVMMEQGLLKEVESVVDYRDKTALKTVGYTEIFHYFDGKWDLDFAIEEIKKNSRRYAKRQLTWYRKADDIHHIAFGYCWQDVLSLLEQNCPKKED